VEPILDRLTAHLSRTDPGGVLSVSLFGSGAVNALRPDSDLDVLVLTRRSLSRCERQQLVDFLLQFSGKRATVTAARALEVTALVVDDVVPWAYPPVCDFLYGEWLRDDLVAGHLPERHRNPDVVVLITTARQHAIWLLGQHPAELLSPVPQEELHRALHDSVGSLLTDLAGDERNVLLTLARMIVTLETGQIVGKDMAAHLLMPSLQEPDRSTLSLAAEGYAGEAVDDWSCLQAEASDTASRLAARIRSSHPEGDAPTPSRTT
jgi:predicted nucleotidyltransferase